MAVTTPALSESYYPADQSEPVLDTTVGGILRDAAEAVPDQPALIGGHPDPAAAPALDVRRAARGRGALRPRAARALRARRARRRVGAQHPRVGGAWSSARRWPA